jgi:anti-sigma B factor antagonist
MESTSAPPPLTVELSTQIVYGVATLSGEITFSNHREAEEKLFQTLDSTGIALVVDLAGLDFCDSAGLNTFVRVLRRAGPQGKTVVVAGLTGRVAAIFETTGLDRAFPLHPDVDAAIHWLETGERPAQGSRP